MEEPEKGLPPSSDIAEEQRLKAEEAFRNRLGRIARAYGTKLPISDYIKQLRDAKEGLPSPVDPNTALSDPDEDLSALAEKLEECARMLTFLPDLDTGERLLKSWRCRHDLLCPFCAIQRSSRNWFHYGPRFSAVRDAYPNLKIALLTLTIKNGFDLQERLDHLFYSLKKFKDKRRNKKSGGRCVTELSKVAGAMGSYEVTYSQKHGWHPHLHMIVFLEEFIVQKELSLEWERITGDSNVVDIRLLDQENLQKSLNEVFKYALKFHSLLPEQTFQCYQVLKRRKKIFTLGVARGHKIEKPRSNLNARNLGPEEYYQYQGGSYQAFAPDWVIEEEDLMAVVRRFREKHPS